MATTTDMYKITLVCFFSESSPVEASAMSLAFMESEIPVLMGAESTYQFIDDTAIGREAHELSHETDHM